MFDYNALLKEMSEVEDRIAARDLREREAELEIAKQSAPPPQLTTTLDSTPGPARPTALKPRLESIPHELKEISNWVLWRYEPPKNPNGKWRKVPYQPNGYKADTTNPHTWSSFETVCAVYELGNYDGIGFVFDGEVGPDGTCLAGIDLDRCMDAAKSKFQHLALERIKRLRTYTEASPSGTGLHMIARTEPVESVKTKEFELYTTGRYFTFTGRKWDADSTIRVATAEVRALIAESRAKRVASSQNKPTAAPFKVAEAFAHLDPNENLGEGLSTDYWYDLLRGEQKDEVVDHALEVIASKTPLLELEENGGNNDQWYRLTTAVARSGAPNAPQIFLKYASAAKNADPKDALQEYFARCQKGTPLKGRGITVGTLLGLASEHGADFEPWRSPGQPAAPEPEPLVVPRDLWAKFEAPPLPTGLLPEAIEKFAFAQAELMGCDPAGIAMGALTVCAAAIPDEINLRVKQHDPRWRESTRLWTGLVGPPSTMKSPVMLRTIEPLKRIDNRALARYMEAMAAYEKLAAEQRSEKPKLARIMLGDTTPEAAQLVLQDNPNGVMLFRDELSGWFGSMDKYSGHRGAASDRGFWLQSFNGGQYYVDRVTRRSGSIPNLSVSILGGIQVEPLRALVAEGVDDGLIQRIFPIMLRPAVLGKDEPLPADQYDNLVERLNEMSYRSMEFDAAAQQIRRKLEQKHLDLAAYESVNKKLAAHIGKYNGLFARLCLLWHCIETVDTTGIIFNGHIDADTAQRVADFLHRFLLPHAISFYVGVVGLADDHDRLANVAGYILAHKLERITNRDVARGDRNMRLLHRVDVESIFNRLDALGWISKVQGRRFSDVQWVVNPEVHRLFEKRAKAEAERRQRERAVLVAGIRSDRDGK
jgi:Protein of unknown function (DUF3987)